MAKRKSKKLSSELIIGIILGIGVLVAIIGVAVYKKSIPQVVSYNRPEHATNYFASKSSDPLLARGNTHKTHQSSIADENNLDVPDSYEPDDPNSSAYTQENGAMTLGLTQVTLPFNVGVSFLPDAGNQKNMPTAAAWTITYGIMGWYNNRFNLNNITMTGPESFAPVYTYQHIFDNSKPVPIGVSYSKVLTSMWYDGILSRNVYHGGNTDLGDVDLAYDLPSSEYNDALQIGKALKYARFDLANLKLINIFDRSKKFLAFGLENASNEEIKQAFINAFEKYQVPFIMGIDAQNDSFIHANSSNWLVDDSAPFKSINHIVVAYGVSDQGISIRNSMGQDWGNNGDAILSWNWISHHLGNVVVMLTDSIYDSYYALAPANFTASPVTTSASAWPIGRVYAQSNMASEKFTWGQSQNATYYTIGITVHGQNLWFKTQTPGNDPSIVIDNLQPNTQYDAVITACNTYGCGESAPNITFTTGDTQSSQQQSSQTRDYTQLPCAGQDHDTCFNIYNATVNDSQYNGDGKCTWDGNGCYDVHQNGRGGQCEFNAICASGQSCVAGQCQ